MKLDWKGRGDGMIAEKVLKECRVFSTLTGAELEKIASLAIEKQFEAGTVILEGKDFTEELIIVEDGKVALQMELPTSQPQTSRRTTVDLVTRYEMLGWPVTFGPFDYSFTAVCLTKTAVLAINGMKLRQMLRDNPHLEHEILSGFIKVLASRLYDTFQVLISERLLAY